MYSSWELYKVLNRNRFDFDKYIKYSKRSERFVDDIDWGLYRDYFIHFYDDKNPVITIENTRINRVAKPYITDLRKNNLSCLISKYVKDAIKLCQYNEDEDKFYVYPFNLVTDSFTIKQIIVEGVCKKLRESENKFSFYMDETYPHYTAFIKHITEEYKIETVGNIHTVTKYK